MYISATFEGATRLPNMADQSSSTVTVKNCAVRLMRGGAGQPVLFLHGGGGVPSWLPFLARLGEKFDVLVPEHPGFGQSEMPSWLDSISDLANFYLDFLEELDLQGVHLVGHSLGGWIAADLAVRNASRLASLTLISSGGIHVEGVEQADTFLSNDEQRVRDLFYDQKLADEALARTRRPEFEDVLLKNRATTARLVWQPRSYDPQLQKWLHRIRVPTLLLWGDHDRLFPKEHALAYERLIPGARAVVIPDCGHLPHVEKAEACAIVLEAFLETRKIAA